MGGIGNQVQVELLVKKGKGKQRAPLLMMMSTESSLRGSLKTFYDLWLWRQYTIFLQSLDSPSRPFHRTIKWPPFAVIPTTTYCYYMCYNYSVGEERGFLWLVALSTYVRAHVRVSRAKRKDTLLHGIRSRPKWGGCFPAFKGNNNNNNNNTHVLKAIGTWRHIHARP